MEHMFFWLEIVFAREIKSKIFLPQVHKICRAGFFRIATFSEHLLPTACQYSMLLPLTKTKSQNIKVIGDKKSVSNLRAN